MCWTWIAMEPAKASRALSTWSCIYLVVSYVLVLVSYVLVLVSKIDAGRRRAQLAVAG